MIIRRAIDSDIPVLVDFQQRMAKETEDLHLDETILRSGVKAMINDPSKGYYKVLEIDGEIVACHMITFEWSDWRNGMVLWIQSVYVKQSHRKQGMFKKLYQHLVEEVSNDNNIRGIRLYVEKNNQAAQRTYSNLGMNGDHYQVYEWMKS